MKKKRNNPILVATRVTLRQRAVIDAAAAAEGVSISELLREIIVPAAAARLTASVAGPEHTDVTA